MRGNLRNAYVFRRETRIWIQSRVTSRSLGSVACDTLPSPYAGTYIDTRFLFCISSLIFSVGLWLQREGLYMPEPALCPAAWETPPAVLARLRCRLNHYWPTRPRTHTKHIPGLTVSLFRNPLILHILWRQVLGLLWLPNEGEVLTELLFLIK